MFLGEPSVGGKRILFREAFLSVEMGLGSLIINLGCKMENNTIALWDEFAGYWH